jgi:hypothetical protein
VARGLDGARVFATIFLRRVRVLSARQGKMWDYEHDEPQEELRDPASSGLWRWLDGMIAGEGRRPIDSPSPFRTGSPPNLVTTSLVFHLSLLVVTSWSTSVSFTICIGRDSASPNLSLIATRGGRSRSPSRAAAEGCGEEEEEGASCPGA